MKNRPVCLALIIACLLGVHKGFVALWTQEDKYPSHIFPYRVESLPISDQEALKRGIPIHTEAELYQYLEDYLS